jgi:hypothetical protein
MDENKSKNKQRDEQERNSHSTGKEYFKGKINEMELGQQARTATDGLKARRRRRRRERDAIGATSTDGNSHPESEAQTKAT